MRVLVVLTLAPNKGFDDLKPLLETEARHTWDRFKADVVREVFLMGAGRTGAVLLLEVPTIEDARREVSVFPLVAAGLLTPDCIALAPFVAWEGLFRPGK